MSWIKRHRGLVIFLALIFLAGAALFFSAPERRATGYFYRHLEELEENAARWQAGEPLSYDPELTVNVWGGEHEIVEYIVVSRGSAPSGTYYGFFYSPDGVPMSFQNSGEALTRRDQDQWVWQGDGDNHGYVEFLRPCWYYFEASL